MLLLLLLVAAAYGVLNERNDVRFQKTNTPTVASLVASPAPPINRSSDALLVQTGAAVDRAFEAQARHVQVEVQGKVVKVLRDDSEGSRHQKFLLRLPSGLTILIAHNIDLTPRIEDLKSGDMMEFNGEYEWNEKGGVVHWTHRDPAGRHRAGWLKRNGQFYQ